MIVKGRATQTRFIPHWATATCTLSLWKCFYMVKIQATQLFSYEIFICSTNIWPSEQLTVSDAGDIYDEKRNCLASEKAESLMFVNDTLEK